MRRHAPSLLAGIFLLAGWQVGSAAAQRGGTVELVPLARYAFYPESLSLNNALGIGAEVGLFVNRRLSLEVGWTYAVTNLPDSASVEASTLTGRFLVHLPLQGQTTALLGAGYTQERFVRGLDLGQEGPGGLIGFRFGLGPRIGLRLEALADYLRKPGGASTGAWNVSAQGGLSIYAGPLGPRDSDHDGVPNAADRCPGTPPGQSVDPTGCGLQRDSDGDGVLDGGDRCPGTPAGQRVDVTGCNADLDGDGVPNAVDRCPDTPPGSTTDQFGCPPARPAPDSDRDGVADDRDRCPGTAPDSPVDGFGCARPADPPHPPLVLTDVTFATGSATLTATARVALRAIADSLLARPPVRLEIAGYTDDTGSRAANERLSLARAEAVRAFLVAAGVPADLLAARGYGPADPVASNDTAEGRARNRRVELHRVP